MISTVVPTPKKTGNLELTREKALQAFQTQSGNPTILTAFTLCWPAQVKIGPRILIQWLDRNKINGKAQQHS